MAAWPQVGEEMLLGAEEGGFAGLEEMDDPLLIQQLVDAAGGGRRHGCECVCAAARVHVHALRRLLTRPCVRH